jgi:membrane-associated phospholipid phosphatase
VSDTGAIDRFDRAVEDLFDHLRGNPVADRVFYVASELGDFSLIWHLVGTAQGVVRPDGFRRTVHLAAALGVESALVNGVIKSAFRRERPVFEAERPHKLRMPRTTSFPSGHASSAFLAAALLSDDSHGAPLFYALAAVVAASRVHVRIHHASDVVGGAVLGIALGAITKRILRAL